MKPPDGIEKKKLAKNDDDDARSPEQAAGFSIKHDMARSCFQFWLKIGDEGGKILKKKTGEALAETVFFSKFCHPLR